MRYFVLGNSGSDGQGLRSADEAWPNLLAHALTLQQGSTVSVTGVRLWPSGQRAVQIALEKVREASPDVVILSVNAFPCVVPVVAESVRKRFGERAARLYGRAERRFNARTTGGGGLGTGIHSRTQRLAHRLLGARPYLTVDEAGRVYAEVLHGLAREEGLEVVALVEARFSEENQRRYPRLLAAIERLHGIVLPAAEAHRFRWLDIEPAFRSTGREGLWMPDGVHLTAAGNRVYAAFLSRELRT